MDYPNTAQRGTVLDMEIEPDSRPLALRVDALTREFGDVRAVDELSFHVERGEVYGLLGPNGAGKTTTLRILAGMMQPTSGSVEVLGTRPGDNLIELRRRLGYLTADTGLYARLTPREVLTFFARVSGMSDSQVSYRIERLKDELGLGEFIDRRCEKLSSGQTQRTAIARALVHEPDVLIVDEPTATLDVLAAQFILKRLRTEADSGKAVLLSTHHLSEAELVCDRIGVIHRGRLCGEGTVSELKQATGADSLTEAFLRLVTDAPDGAETLPVEITEAVT